jgi:hypothetical protein
MVRRLHSHCETSAPSPSRESALVGLAFCRSLPNSEGINIRTGIKPMNRRLLLGLGAIGVVAVGAYFGAGSRPKTEEANAGAALGSTDRPTLVFVGHEL